MKPLEILTFMRAAASAVGPRDLLGLAGGGLVFAGVGAQFSWGWAAIALGAPLFFLYLVAEWTESRGRRN